MSPQGASRGSVVGIGVGPGDPGLLTLKAVAELKSADVVVSPNARGRPSRARRIVEAHLNTDCRELAVELVMSSDRRDALASYDRLTLAVNEEIARGCRVALLCEGDPLLFGTFIRVLDRLEPGTPVDVVPGIAAYAATAAVEAWPLATAEDGFGVLAASMGPERLRACLEALTSAAILKTGKRLDMVRGVLAELGLLEGAKLAIEIGTDKQQVLPVSEWPDERAPYFSLLLTRGLGGQR